MLYKLPRYSIICLSLILVIVLSGCSSSSSDQPETAKISGQVLMGKKPLPLGLIFFETTDGKTKVSTLILNGHYEAKAPIGELKVAVKTSQYSDPEYIAGLRQTASTTTDMHIPGDEETPEQKTENEKMKKVLAMVNKARMVPLKYEKTSTSGLTVTVPESGTTKDFTLQPR